MIVLGIETATSVGSIAIISEEKLIGEFTVNLGLIHSETLLPLIDQLLKMVRIKFSQIDGLAVSIGPGSFTGLRVGISTIKGLALAGRKPVVGVSTLDALAYNFFWFEGLICPMLDAKKKEVYTAGYRWDLSFHLKRVTPYLAVSPEKFIENIKEKVVFLGEGSQIYECLLKERLGKNAYFASPPLKYPRAATIAWLGSEEIKRGKVVDIHKLTPIYIRPSEAELRKET